MSLHLLRASGEMVTGLAANVAVWQHTRFGALWRLLMLPGILSGCVIAFAAALGDFGATITFVGNVQGETQTLSLAI